MRARGEAVGEAALALLYGDANPCGKLAETFPLRLEDTPCYLSFPGDGKTAEYREGIFVGYRYYDAKNMAVQYPFGHGLSYTSFAYRDIKLSHKKLRDTDTLTVTVQVKNTGAAVRPQKELRDFKKVFLKPGEEATVSMKLTKRAFAWYHPQWKDWYAQTGAYEILVGASSRDIRLRAAVTIESTDNPPFQIDANTVVADILSTPETQTVFEEYLNKLWRAFGKPKTDEMTKQMISNLPLHAIKSFYAFSSDEMQQLIRDLNRALAFSGETAVE